MKRTWAAAFLGALAGTLTAATVLLAFAFYISAGMGYTLGTEDANQIFLTTGSTAGPGAFLLGLPLSVVLRRSHDHGRPRGSILALGTLAGLLLGLLNLAAVLLLVGNAPMQETVLKLTWPVGAAYVAAALAGGAALGLGCAWVVSRPSKEPS